MSYGAYEAFDDLLGALKIETDSDSISEQTDLCLAEIERLQAIAAQVGKLLPAVNPKRPPAREYMVEITATNRTTLSRGNWHARNRAHAAFLALSKLGHRGDIASLIVEKIGGSSRGKGAESARAIAERAAS
jgi:hypothetical protein